MPYFSCSNLIFDHFFPINLPLYSSGISTTTFHFVHLCKKTPKYSCVKLRRWSAQHPVRTDQISSQSGWYGLETSYPYPTVEIFPSLEPYKNFFSDSTSSWRSSSALDSSIAFLTSDLSKSHTNDFKKWVNERYKYFNNKYGCDNNE